MESKIEMMYSRNNVSIEVSRERYWRQNKKKMLREKGSKKWSKQWNIEGMEVRKKQGSEGDKGAMKGRSCYIYRLQVGLLSEYYLYEEALLHQSSLR